MARSQENPDIRQWNSGDDNARLFALKFVGAGELAAEKFDEAAGAGAAIGAQKAHAEEKDQQLKNLRVLHGAEGRLRVVLLRFVEKSGQGVVKLALNGRHGWLFIDDAGDKGFVRVSERAECREDIGIRGGRLRGAELCDGEGDRGEKLAVNLNRVRGDADVEKRRVCGKGARMLVFVAVGRKEIAAVGRAVDGDFSLRAAADGTNFLGLSRAKAARFALLANWTSHKIP